MRLGRETRPSACSVGNTEACSERKNANSGQKPKGLRPLTFEGTFAVAFGRNRRMTPPESFSVFPGRDAEA